jgi:hypothetical protein
MTIFVSLMLMLLIPWGALGSFVFYKVLTEEDVGELDLGKVFIFVVVPFIGLAACLGYLFG